MSTDTITREADISPEDLRAARRAAYSHFSLAAEARALELVKEANQAQLRNFIDDLRADHPTAQTFQFSTDDDGYLVVDFVRDEDGNDMEEAAVDLLGLLLGAEAEEMQTLGHVTHDIDEMLAWEPAGGLTRAEGKAIGALLNERYAAARAQLQAHDLNDWVADVHIAYPEAAFAHVNIESYADDVRYTAGIDLYKADGSPIDPDMQIEATLELGFGTGWDLSKHETPETGVLFGPEAKVFSFRSIQDAWAAVQFELTAAVGPVR